MKYFVYNHHDFWQYPMGGSSLLEADVVFMWSDWPYPKEIAKLHLLGKKVIIYEHGFGSAFDYELNNREPIADGYLVLGQESKNSLIRAYSEPSLSEQNYQDSYYNNLLHLNTLKGGRG